MSFRSKNRDGEYNCKDMQWVINARIAKSRPKAEAYLETCQTSELELSAQSC